MAPPKGLDDLLHLGKRPWIREYSHAPRNLTERRRPRSTPESGHVDRGGTLESIRTETIRAVSRFIKRSKAGSALVVRTPPGAGKSTAIAAALESKRSGTRIFTGTKKLAEEMAGTWGYSLIVGRSPANCGRFEEQAALGARGFPVEKLACGTTEEPRCPFRGTCGYFQQFDDFGTWVTTSEQVYNTHVLMGAGLLVFDDADLPRAMIEMLRVSPEALASAREQLSDSPLQRLIGVLQQAVMDAPGKVTGPEVWDHLAVVARQRGCTLEELVESLPAVGRLPTPQGMDGVLTMEDIEGVPPASLQSVVDVLAEELPSYLSQEPFNCRIRISAEGLEVGRLREPTVDRDGQAYASRMAILVADATPALPFVEHLLADHERVPDVDGQINLPEAITVVQYTDGTNSHRAMQQHGPREALLLEVEKERRLHPVEQPEDEAVICYKNVRDIFIEAGFHSANVLTFGSVRGTNVLSKVRRLHVVGRPLPPPADTHFLAQVVFHDESFVSPRVALGPATFGGQPYEVDVLDFVDPRAASLLRASRDDELLQVVHRARLFEIVDQLALEEELGRHHVRLVIHGSHPIPGLRVDELVLPSDDLSINERRHRDAVDRVRTAVLEIQGKGLGSSTNAVALHSGASWRVAQQAMEELGFGCGESGMMEKRNLRHTYIETPTGDTPPREASPSTSFGNVRHTYIEISSNGVKNVPKTGDRVLLPEGEPCRCYGCSACAPGPGFILHADARLSGDWYRGLGICRWCELKGGHAA